MSLSINKNKGFQHQSCSQQSDIYAQSSQNFKYVTSKKLGINSSEVFEAAQTPIDKKVLKKKSPPKKKVKNEEKIQPLQRRKPKQTKLHSSLLQLTNKYKTLGKIGQGGFGFIHKAMKIDSGLTVAIKFEKHGSYDQSSNRLEIEARLLKMFTETKEFGFPKFIEFKQMKEFSYLIMELLGLNLEQLLKFQKNQRFSLKTVCMIGIEMLDRLQVVHNRQYIYRDVKPENVVIGGQMNYRTIYMIDLGLAKSYKNLQGQHIEEIQRKGLVGTPRYASINSHEGKELSRRDDLESLAYMLIYLYRGTLPWVNVLIQDKKKKREQIKKLKMETSVRDICAGMPIQFVKFLDYSRKLKFKERPSYDYLCKLLKKALKNENLKFDYHFDWELVFNSKNDFKRIMTQEKKLTTDTPVTPSKDKFKQDPAMQLL